MIIAIDFDGTIVRSEYPVIIEEMPHAGEIMRSLKKRGHYIILWTCRTGDSLLEAINWLLLNNIIIDRINDHNPDNASLYDNSGKKIYADLYIDDKQVGGFPGWLEIDKYIKQLEK